MGIRSVKFRGRHNSWKALLVLVTGSLSIIAFIVMVVLSAVHNAAAPYFGTIGVISAIADLSGIIVSVMTTKERDIYMSVPIAGMVVNGFGFLMYVIVYIMGAV